MILTTVAFFALTAVFTVRHLKKTEAPRGAPPSHAAGPPCLRCGRPLPAGSTFCPGCGVSQQVYELVSAKASESAAPQAGAGGRLHAMVRADVCVGCGTCAIVCPPRAIEVTEKINKEGVSTRKLTLRQDTCIFCGQCVANCITEKGIRQTHEYDLAVFNREQAVEEIEKELVLCSCCGEVIGTKEQFAFLARKLGLLASGNPLLILASQEELKLVTEDPHDKDAPAGRANMFRILCPKCRHQAVLTDIWG